MKAFVHSNAETPKTGAEERGSDRHVWATRARRLLLLASAAVLCSLLSTVAWQRTAPSRPVHLWQRGDAVPPSPLPYTTGKKAITLAASLLVPQLEEAALQNTFPPMSMDRVSINEMHLEHFSVKSVKVLLATPSPDNVTVNVADLKMTIPNTGFVFTYGIFTCYGVFRLQLDSTQLSFNVHPSIADETLRIAVGQETTTITWGELKIEHDLDSTLCRIGQSIVQFFIGKVDELIEKNIKEQLPVMLPKDLADKANEALLESGLRFSAPLVMTPDRATSQIELIPRSTAALTAAPLCEEAEAALVGGTPLPERDVAAVLYSTSVDNSLAYWQSRNLLNTSMLLPANVTAASLQDVFPEAYKLCNDCAVAIGLAAGEPPSFTFRKAGSVVQLRAWQVVCGVYFLPRNQEQYQAMLQHARRHRRLEDSPAAGGGVGAAATPPRPFPIFKHADRWHPASALSGWKGLSQETPLTEPPAVPVVAFSLNTTLAVGDLASTGAKRRALQYRILPIEDLSLSLMESNMGPVDADKFTADLKSVFNRFLIPLANADSPAAIPGPIKEIFVSVEDGSLAAGVNISFF